MQEHISSVVSDEIHVHCQSKRIRNKYLISLMSNKVRRTIAYRIQKANYFGVILVCTPYNIHKEQMSLTIRCISDGRSKKNVPAEINEHFITFIEVEETAANTYSKFCFPLLKELGVYVLQTFQGKAMTTAQTRKVIN